MVAQRSKTREEKHKSRARYKTISQRHETHLLIQRGINDSL
jgi:hypothetical protein